MVNTNVFYNRPYVDPSSKVDLKQNLDRLRVVDETEMFGDREKLLDNYVKQGYLHRAKVGDDPNSDVLWQYYWGPRAKAEVADSEIADFIISVSVCNKALFERIYPDLLLFKKLYDVENDRTEQLRKYIFKAAGYDIKN